MITTTVDRNTKTGALLLGGDMKVLGVRWFTGRDTVGVVKVETEFDGIRYYVGAGKGLDEQSDMQYICDWGAKVSDAIGEAIFA